MDGGASTLAHATGAPPVSWAWGSRRVQGQWWISVSGAALTCSRAFFPSPGRRSIWKHRSSRLTSSRSSAWRGPPLRSALGCVSGPGSSNSPRNGAKSQAIICGRPQGGSESGPLQPSIPSRSMRWHLDVSRTRRCANARCAKRTHAPDYLDRTSNRGPEHALFGPELSTRKSSVSLE